MDADPDRGMDADEDPVDPVGLGAAQDAMRTTMATMSVGGFFMVSDFLS
jgi:hypothetical protein